MSLQDLAILAGVGLIAYYFYDQTPAPAPVNYIPVSNVVPNTTPSFWDIFLAGMSQQNTGENPTISYYTGNVDSVLQVGSLSDILGIDVNSNFNVLSNNALALTTNSIDVNAAEQIAEVKIQLREGRKNIAYLDSKGILTVGIGHKVLSSEHITLGESISDEMIDNFFAADIQGAANLAVSQARDLGVSDTDFVAALINVNFQLGNFQSVLYGTYDQLKAGNPTSAISHIQASAWAQQTPVRAQDFISAIQQTYNV